MFTSSLCPAPFSEISETGNQPIRQTTNPCVKPPIGAPGNQVGGIEHRPSGSLCDPASPHLRARNGEVIQADFRPRRRDERRPASFPGELKMGVLPAVSQIGPFAPTQTKRPSAKGRIRHPQSRRHFVLSRTHNLDHRIGGRKLTRGRRLRRDVSIHSLIPGSASWERCPHGKGYEWQSPGRSLRFQSSRQRGRPSLA